MGEKKKKEKKKKTPPNTVTGSNCSPLPLSYFCSPKANNVYLVGLLDRITNYAHVHKGRGRKSVTQNRAARWDTRSQPVAEPKISFPSGCFEVKQLVPWWILVSSLAMAKLLIQ